MKKAIVLCSGGVDSTTALAIAKEEGYELYALSFDYGQRHQIEIQRAKAITQFFGVKDHRVIKMDLRQIGGSALTGDLSVPKDRSGDEIGAEIPVTYVPARNTIFLSFALAWAEVLGAEAVFVGVNALDYSGYPDCRPEYIEAFELLAHLATKAGVEKKLRLEIKTPLIHMTKAQIIQKGQQLGVPFHLTHSCYDPTPKGTACGRCDSCILRKKGFEEAGIKDPIAYDA
ncbi:MAG: 7-cyano-7-deazaguanine synthase QueC [Nitrospira sp.]|nr:7-cyano-7-deazaguanine synthase QueC [Nitrospira sp.]